MVTVYLQQIFSVSLFTDFQGMWTLTLLLNYLHNLKLCSRELGLLYLRCFDKKACLCFTVLFEYGFRFF